MMNFPGISTETEPISPQAVESIEIAEPMVSDTPILNWLHGSILAKLDWEKVLYGVFFTSAILTRLWDLGARVMSHDESLHTYFSYNLATGKGFAHTPLMHGPFLFHVTALSYFLFGDSDFTSRIPAAVFGIVLVILPYFLRRWLGRNGALMTSFALLISPSILYHARYIRQEEFILVWTVLTVLCVWRYLIAKQPGWLVGLAIVLAFHATDKSTSFLTVALLITFLAPLALLQFYNARRRVVDVLQALGFTAVTGIALIGVEITFAVASQALASQFNLVSVVAQLNPLTLTFDFKSLVYAALVLLLGLMLSAFMVVVLLGLFRKWLQTAYVQAPAFNILVVLVTTTMFMASPALLLVLNPIFRLTTGNELVKITLLGDMANLATNPTVIATMFGLSVGLIAISAAIGIAWNWRKWLQVAGVFLAITTTFFTTVFTNAAGFGTGFVGQLGYWMAQQNVQRGSQPPYYYFLIVPMYEYMLVIGAVCAIVYITYRILRLVYVYSARPATVTTDTAITPNPVDILTTRALANPDDIFPIFLVWWSIATWVIYTMAGEKMPWLTVHFALPMAMLTGWFLNRVLSPITRGGHLLNLNLSGIQKLTFAVLALITILLLVRVLSLIGSLDLAPGDMAAIFRWVVTSVFTCIVIGIVIMMMRKIAWQYAGKALILASFGVLSILTIRTAFTVTYINYDYTKEFLFYAHGAPGTKLALAQIDDLSQRIYGDRTIRVGYDSDTSWPMSWYMRQYPNARYFTDALPSDFADLDAIMIGDVNPKRSENEAKLLDNYTRYNYMLVWWPMQDYFDLNWDRISYSLFNPQARAALWDIAFNRDFTKYSSLFGKTSLTVDKWSPGHRFALYIRNDVAVKVWDYRIGASGTLTSSQTTPKLLSPVNLALAPSGDRYIIDHKANRVIHTDSSGNIIGAFGSAGAASARFNDPWGIAIDNEGNIFVADTFNHRIQKFDANGGFVTSWGTPGVSSASGAGLSTIFFGPRAIVLDKNNNLLVSDTGNKRIQVFDKDGNYIAQFGIVGTRNGEFNEPVGLAVDDTGNVYVADTWNQRIQVFDPTYHYLRSWTVQPWIDMDQLDLQSVDHKPFMVISGNVLLVSSPKTHQVLAFTLQGKVIDLPDITFPSDSLPTGLAVSGSQLLVTLANNGQVLSFSMPR